MRRRSLQHFPRDLSGFLLSCRLLLERHGEDVRVRSPTLTMPPPCQPRQYRWQHDGKSPYAPRFGKKEWEKYEKDIKSWHAEGRTKKQIIALLDVKYGFRPSYGQLRKKLDRLLSKVTHSVKSPSPSTCRLQSRSSAPTSRPDSVGHQLPLLLPRSESDVRLTPNEEEMFRTYTSILDEGNEANITHAKCSPTNVRGTSGPDRQQAQPNKLLALLSPATSLSGDQRASTITAEISQANRMHANPHVDMAVDDELVESGSVLADQRPTSTDSEDPDGLRTQLYRESRERRECEYPNALHLNVSRIHKTQRVMRRYISCACGKGAHPSNSKSPQHKRCSLCQQRPGSGT